MDQELYKRAQQPGCNPLREMTDAAHADVSAALTAALVRPAALELADALEGEAMEKLREAAAEPLAAVDAARKALAAEQKSIAGRLAAFWQSKRRADPDDHERAPATDPPAVQALKAALSAAEQEATPFESSVRALGYKIDELRAAPGPDPAVLATLAAVLEGGHVDAE